MTADVWLPIPPEEIAGLPEGPGYLFWNGDHDYPGDPADCVVLRRPVHEARRDLRTPLPDMTHVQVLQTLSAGVDNVQPGLGRLRPGVRLCNARGVHEASTGELALALILASLRGIPDFVRAQDKGEWRGGFRPALADKTALIVGYGSIGAAIEDRLAPFELARVARVARSERTTARGPVHPLTELPALLPEADVVILATPLTDQTRGLVDAEFLARMKDGALLVNVARGPVVDTLALLAELETGRLTAALDVTDRSRCLRDTPCGRRPACSSAPMSAARPPRSGRAPRGCSSTS